jgi:3'-5' exoribonuclease
MIMSSKPISEMVFEDTVTGFFAVRKKTVRESVRGPFVSLELGDHSGRINAVCWDPDQFCLVELDSGMVIKIKGTVGEYQDKKQLAISRIRLATSDEYELEDILPHSTIPIEERRARILSLVDRIENSYLKALADSFFQDDTFLEDFLTSPAGKLWHHAFIGGLSEHSANVAELAMEVGLHYDFLDKDILLFGGLFHDAGKMASYSTGTMIDFTDDGRLIGHIVLMDQWLCERAKKIEAFPDKLLTKVRHILLSHQGEYDTPVKPMVPEAFIVYFCDEIDSKMGAIERIRSRHDGVGWSDYVNLLSRYLYFGENPEE